MGQPQPSLGNRELIQDDLGVDVVKVVTVRQFRLANACHLGRILADEVHHIRHACTSLKQEAATPQVIHPRLALREPGVVAVELCSEPGVHARSTVIPRLVDVDMQYEVVDPLAEGPVAAGLEGARRVLEGRATGERLGRDDRFAIGVCRRRGRPALDRTEVAGDPELAADAVGLPAVLQELGREAPVSVVLQPQAQALRPA